jgi:hypothetical protein
MPALRAAASASRALARPTLRFPLSFSGARAFSQSKPVLGGGGESHYDAPGGWLFGVKPGEKYEKEGWENVTYYGFVGSIIFGVVAYAFKPDTRYVEIVSVGGDGWGGGMVGVVVVGDGGGAKSHGWT